MRYTCNADEATNEANDYDKSLINPHLKFIILIRNFNGSSDHDSKPRTVFCL